MRLAIVTSAGILHQTEVDLKHSTVGLMPIGTPISAREIGIINLSDFLYDHIRLLIPK